MSNTAVANVTKAPTRSLLTEMATRYGMEPAVFASTLRATVVPKETTNEEFAAFLMVAREYELNPVLKEIYAFPKRGGGIQPIVSIDGWCNLINSHPQLNGIEFDDHKDGDKVSAITCRIWRKDREKPIVVTEYLSECVRNTDPWKQYPRRMLRHKALIQCARYAFGFAGIVDPDEAERMGADVTSMRDVTPPKPPAPPPAPEPTVDDAGEATLVPETPAPRRQTRGERQQADFDKAQADAKIPDAEKDPESFLRWIDESLAPITEIGDLETAWNDSIEPRLDAMFPPDKEEALGIFRKHEARLAP